MIGERTREKDLLAEQSWWRLAQILLGPESVVGLPSGSSTVVGAVLKMCYDVLWSAQDTMG